MKKLLAIACAVSVVALMSGANAADQGQLTLKGHVDNVMVLTGGDHSGSGTVGGSALDKTVTLASFSTSGVTNAQDEGDLYSVNSNVNFKATVTSANGGLLNGDVTVPYTVGVGGDPEVTSAVAKATGATKNFDHGSAVAVAVDYTVTQGHSVPLGGDYTDILTLAIAAQ
jgi:hypothetical protein